MRVWKIYEIPILLVAVLNWLALYAFSYESVYIGFWWIVLFFSFITLLFSLLIEWSQKSSPINFFTCFALGKALKFILSVGFLLLVFITEQDNLEYYCITIGLLFLVTLIVDTGLFLKFTRTLKDKKS